MVFLRFGSHMDFVSVDSSSEGFPASREIQVYLNPSAAGIWHLCVGWSQRWVPFSIPPSFQCLLCRAGCCPLVQWGVGVVWALCLPIGLWAAAQRDANTPHHSCSELFCVPVASEAAHPCSLMPQRGTSWFTETLLKEVRFHCWWHWNIYQHMSFDSVTISGSENDVTILL